MTREHRGEAGFTLVEVLIVVTVLGLIMGPLTAAVIFGLRWSDYSSNLARTSNDAQLVALYLPSDVESAGNQTGDVVAAPTANTDCSGVTNVLRINWRETGAGGTTTTYTAAYAVVSGSGQWQLERYYCVNGGTPATSIVATKLPASTSASATVSGTRISLTVTETQAVNETSPYVFTVSAVRRTP